MSNTKLDEIKIKMGFEERTYVSKEESDKLDEANPYAFPDGVYRDKNTRYGEPKYYTVAAKDMETQTIIACLLYEQLEEIKQNRPNDVMKNDIKTIKNILIFFFAVNIIAILWFSFKIFS